jgi:hypothetical protein
VRDTGRLPRSILATVAKIVPILIFIAIAAWAFQTSTFQSNFWPNRTELP